MPRSFGRSNESAAADGSVERPATRSAKLDQPQHRHCWTVLVSGQGAVLNKQTVPGRSRLDPDDLSARRFFSGWRVVINRDFEGPLRRDDTTADLGNAAEDRGVEIARATGVANANRHIFQDDKVPLVPQRLPIDSPLTDGAVTVLASKTVHLRHLT